MGAYAEYDVVVIGGGIAGLTAGSALAEYRKRVLVLEACDHLGGRAASFVDEKTGDVVDLGPHVLFSEYPNFLKLLQMCGTRDRIVWQKGAITRVFVNGKIYRFKPLSFLPPPVHFLPLLFANPSKAANTKVVWKLMSLTEADILELDKETAAEWLSQAGVGKEAIERFWGFASMAIMNVPVEEASAGALARFINRLIGRSDYTIGFADRGLGTLFTEQAKKLIENAGGKVVTLQKVTKLGTEQRQFRFVELEDGEKIFAPACISTVPLPYLSALLPKELTMQGGKFGYLSSFVPSPYYSVYLWFDKKITDMQFWAQENKPGYLNLDFYDLTNINKGWESKPSIVASNIIYSKRLGGISSDEIVSGTKKELSRLITAAESSSIIHSRVHPIPMAIHCPYPGTETARPAIETAVDGFYIAGDFSKTFLPASMESSARAGFMAAEAVLRKTGIECKFAIENKPHSGLVGVATRLRLGVAKNK